MDGGNGVAQRFNLGEFLFGQAREAIADVRGKLIDEGWFGRSPDPSGHDIGGNRVDGASGDTTTPTFGLKPSFEESWKPRPPGETREGPEPNGHGMDR